MIDVESKAIKRFYQAILKMQSEEECAKFFEDVCTIKELSDLSQRLEVAYLLSKNKNYQEISNETGASSATISRVNRCYVYGSGGYKNVIERLNGEDK